MRPITIVGTALVLAACTSSREQVDTMSVSSVDTVKPLVDSTAVDSSTGATSGAVPTAPTGTSQPTKTATQAPPRDTTNIGRDRAIQPNTKDPRFRLPVVDTTKRPPR